MDRMRINLGDRSSLSSLLSVPLLLCLLLGASLLALLGHLSELVVIPAWFDMVS